MITYQWTIPNHFYCAQIILKWIRNSKSAYTARPRVTPPHATNCLLERIGGTSLATPGPNTAADGMAGFPESTGTTSPFSVTSYWGPDGSTKIVRRLQHSKHKQVSPSQSGMPTLTARVKVKGLFFLPSLSLFFFQKPLTGWDCNYSDKSTERILT